MIKNLHLFLYISRMGRWMYSLNIHNIIFPVIFQLYTYILSEMGFFSLLALGVTINLFQYFFNLTCILCEELFFVESVRQLQN